MAIPADKPRLRVSAGLLRLCVSLAGAGLVGCVSLSPAVDRHDDALWIDVAPGLRFSTIERTVEFEGTIAMDCHHPRSPDVYLELIACSPDSREHESIVVSSVTPSLIHATLIAIGAEHGKPGSPESGHPPTGQALRVRVIESGDPVNGEAVPVTEWITDAPTRSRRPTDRFVFTGSRIVERENREVYDADGTGVIIGLTAFGSEVVGFTELLSPSATIDEPVWIADPRRVPEIGTPVWVQLQLSDQ